jgi:hypothetical protein
MGLLYAWYPLDPHHSLPLKHVFAPAFSYITGVSSCSLPLPYNTTETQTQHWRASLTFGACYSRRVNLCVNMVTTKLADLQHRTMEDSGSSISSKSPAGGREPRRVRDGLPRALWMVAAVGFWERAAFWGSKFTTMFAQSERLSLTITSTCSFRTVAYVVTRL